MARARSEPMRRLNHACERGDLIEAQNVASQLLGETDLPQIRNLLISASKFGHLNCVRWLVERFDLTYADVVANDSQAFREACSNGHLATAQWLVEHFNLGPENAWMESSDALVNSVINGHQAVAVWLVEFGNYNAEELLESLPFWGGEKLAEWMNPLVKSTTKI